MPPDHASAALRVLLVEDSEDDAELILAQLGAGGARIHAQRVETRPALAAALAERPWDVVLSDFNLPRFTALDALEDLRQSPTCPPLIVVSGFVGEESAVALIKAGAADFVPKTNLHRLRGCIDRCLREAHAYRERASSIAALAESESRYKILVGNLPGLVFRCEISASGPKRWLLLSDRCEALLGMSTGTLRDDPGAFAAAILEEDQAAFSAEFAAAFEGRGTLLWDGRFRHAGDGAVKWLSLRGTVVQPDVHVVVADGIVDDITRHKLAEREILQSREQLRELSGHIEQLKEKERASIAREIHDELGGLLTAAKIELATLARLLPQERLDLTSPAGSCEALIDQAMDTTRRIARRLRPAILDYGILAAVEWAARDFSKRLGIPCDVASANEDFVLEPDRSTGVFRIFQEALTNVARHAQAHRVDVELGPDPGGRMLVLIVTDDGRGVAAGELDKPGAFGIRSMRERAQALEGECQVGAAPGGGTQVVLRVPFAAEPGVQRPPVQLSLES